MLFALGEPVAFASLVAAFLLGLLVRAVAIRFTARTVGLADRGDQMRPSLRHDIDVFGAVGAAIGGMGWGKVLSVDEVPRWRGRGRAAAVFAAGPVACILLGELVIAGYALAFPDNLLGQLTPSLVLHGAGFLPYAEQVVLSLGVGLLGFGLLALVPIPPLDGFGLMWFGVRRPGSGLQWMRLWFEDKNIGVVVLFVCCFFPQPLSPFLMWILDLLGVLFLRVWA